MNRAAPPDEYLVVTDDGGHDVLVTLSRGERVRAVLAGAAVPALLFTGIGVATAHEFRTEPPTREADGPYLYQRPAPRLDPEPPPTLSPECQEQLILARYSRYSGSSEIAAMAQEALQACDAYDVPDTSSFVDEVAPDVAGRAPLDVTVD